jgi:hypothetical protein
MRGARGFAVNAAAAGVVCVGTTVAAGVVAGGAVATLGVTEGVAAATADAGMGVFVGARVAVACVAVSRWLSLHAAAAAVTSPAIVRGTPSPVVVAPSGPAQHVTAIVRMPRACHIALKRDHPRIACLSS